MKKLLIAIFALTFTVNLQAEENEIKTDSKIENVTVYLSGAQVTRKARFSVKKGINKIIFEGVSPRLNQNSLQVKGKGEFIILDVSKNIFYPQPKTIETSTIPKEVLRDIRLLNDSIGSYNDDVEEYILRRNAYETEYNLMLNSGVYKGSVTNDSIELLEKSMAFLRVKLNEINLEVLRLKRKERKHRNALTRMNARLAKLNNYNANVGLGSTPLLPIQQIVVTVSAKEATSGSMKVSYQVYDASWTPSYDLRAENISSPITLSYKANVRQNSGESWDNVKLTLSSVNPNRSNVKPTLAQWYIDFYRPINYPTRTETLSSAGAISKGNNARNRPSLDMDEETLLKDSRSAMDFSTMTENLTSVEFSIDLPYTIESNNKDHLMAVTQDELPATYTHYLVPKLDREAFLVADIVNWQELNLIPAVANIFFDGTYIGQTRLDPGIMSDTMSLSLGRDMGVIVKRKKLKEETKSKPLTSDKVRTSLFEIEIKNNKSRTLNLVVQDQLPKTVNEEIEINATEKSGGKLNDDTGIVEWRFTLRSKDSKKLKFGYSIKFDKDKSLAHL